MEFKDSILKWIMNQNKDYNYINKRFQDTVMNYFLEDYIAPLLMQDYNLQVYREIHVILKNKLKLEKDRVLPKYMGILNIYTNELKDKNRYNEYKRKLCDIVQEETANSSSNYNSAMWKKLVAYLLLEHSVNNNIKNFNGMWQSAFPDRPLKKIKYPTYSKNNTSYYKKRMSILKQKEQEFDEQQNSKNNQLILNMLLGLSSNASSESQSNSSIVCDVSSKPQCFNSSQIQIQHYSASSGQNSQNKMSISQIAYPKVAYLQPNGSSNNCSKNQKKTPYLINEKVEIKQEDFQENNENQRRLSTDEENGNQEEDNEEQASSNSSGLAKIEDQYEYDYPSSQQQSYASSSQSTVSRYGMQQKYPIQQYQQQQQKYDFQQQQQQNQIYYYINSKPASNNNYNNYQNLYNPINNFNPNNNINNNNISNCNFNNPTNFYNNINNNHTNYYNIPEKVSQYQLYQDEVYDEMVIQEQPAMVNGEYNEQQENRQVEEVYYCEEDFPKPFQHSLLGVYGNNYQHSNNFVCNDQYDY